MNRLVIIIAVIAGAIILTVTSALYTVDQRQQAVVLQFGNPVRQITQPGLYFKWPFVQNVVYFERRVLTFDAEVFEATMSDQRRLLADGFAVYRIVDPLRFLNRVQSEAGLAVRLNPIIRSSLNETLGQVAFHTLFTNERVAIARRVTEAVRAEARDLGIEILEVRLTRTDVPSANAQAIFARMQSERQREAAQERAAGQEAAQRINGEAERDRTVVLADAQRQASILRGQGDAEATRIYADAYNRDPQFYAFWRSLQAYRASLGDGGATMVLTPDSEFFRFFRDMRGTSPGRAGVVAPAVPTAPPAPAATPTAPAR